MRRRFSKCSRGTYERSSRIRWGPRLDLPLGRATNRGVVAFYEKLGYAVDGHVSMGRVLEQGER